MAEYITAQQISIGKQIEPINRIKLMSPDEWETLVEEWLSTKDYKSCNIERLAGAGDKGIDVSVYLSDPKENPDNYEWECYQCKRYSSSLKPAEMWVEFGKVIYYSFIKDYPVPNKHYFVGTNGIGMSLSNYLKNPLKLKEALKAQWEKKCEKEITTTKTIPLEGELLKYFDDFNFKIFDKIDAKIIVEEHSAHPNHSIRFGGRGLPSRQIIEEIPAVEDDKHLRYVNQLIKAYDSASGTDIKAVENIENSEFDAHFKRARKSFYNAEELRLLTRDNLPEGIFENLKEDILEGIVNTSEEVFDNGYKKAKAVETKATEVVIDSNPLKEACRPIDRKGICHHLINDEQISWTEDE